MVLITMSFSDPLYDLILIIVFTIGIICKIYYSKIVGWFGEFYTESALLKIEGKDYKVINDLFISYNGKTTQIDHIVISKYGIFVIETKQYNGFITGDKYDKYWVRHLGKKKYNYENPIRQNYGHVKVISEVTNITEKYIHNLVCISSTAKLKIKHNGELVNCYTINDSIKSYKEEVINNYNEIYELLMNLNIKDKRIKKEHIKNIKTNIRDNSTFVCPKCGGKLVERTSTYGKFYGCFNYPKCRYIKK